MNITEPTPALCPKNCGNETRTYSVAGRICREVCEQCREADLRASEAERAASRLSAAMDRFETICRRYPDYNPKTTRWGEVSLESTEAARKWMLREDRAQGLWLCGPSGEGKTRTLFGMMARIAETGQMIGYAPHQQLCDWIAGAAMRETNAVRAIDQLRRADVLVLDDLGKGRATDTATLGLYGLVEHFASRQKPMLLTSQASGEWMESRFNEDSGAAIVRRLSEFCEIVNLK